MFKHEACVECGDCFTGCHYIDYDKETAVKEIQLLKNGIESNVVKECVTCAACNSTCPNKANPFDLILETNEKTAAMPFEPWLKNWFKPDGVTPGKIIPGDRDKPALSICQMDSWLPFRIEGDMFNGMTRIMGGDYFCWMGYIHLGQKEIIKPLLEKTVKNLVDTGYDDIVFIHDECYGAIHYLCKEFDIDIPFRYRHIVHYLYDYLKENKEDIVPLDITVAVQVPCSQRYSQCIPDIHNTLLDIFELIGVHCPPRAYEKERSICCNVCVSHPSKDPGKARELTEKNFDDLIEAGASAVVCMCPVCYSHNFEYAKARGIEMHMIHDLVRRALGEVLIKADVLSFDWNKIEIFLKYWRLFTLPRRFKKYFLKITSYFNY